MNKFWTYLNLLIGFTRRCDRCRKPYQKNFSLICDGCELNYYTRMRGEGWSKNSCRHYEDAVKAEVEHTLQSLETLITAASRKDGWKKLNDAARDGKWKLFRVAVQEKIAGIFTDTRYEIHQLYVDDNGDLIDLNADIFSAWSYEDFDDYMEIPTPEKEKI